MSTSCTYRLISRFLAVFLGATAMAMKVWSTLWYSACFSKEVRLLRASRSAQLSNAT